MATNSNTNGNAKSEWDNKELGVLWQRVSKGGEKYLTGTINIKNANGPDKDIPVIIFQNKRKKEDRHPDLRIYISEKKDSTTSAAPKAKTAPAPAAIADNDLI